MCLAYLVTCVHPLQVVVLLCTLQYCTEYSSIVSLFQAQDVQKQASKPVGVAGTTVFFKALYCKIKSLFFIFCVCLFFMYYLREKYYKPIPLQYYRADCVSWVPRLTVGLTNKLDLTNALSEWNLLVCRRLTVQEFLLKTKTNK